MPGEAGDVGDVGEVGHREVARLQETYQLLRGGNAEKLIATAQKPWSYFVI